MAGECVENAVGGIRRDFQAGISIIVGKSEKRKGTKTGIGTRHTR